MTKRKILDRADIGYLVGNFYMQVGKDELLGLVFNKLLISEQVWEHHIVKLTDFWEMVLLKGKEYTGDPESIHLWVDTIMCNTIEQEHFDRWLFLWEATIEAHFIGDLAQKAIDKSKKMGDSIHCKIMKARSR